MPRKLYEIKDFSGGLNCYADPRDIKDTEFSQNWNVIVDKSGILRIVGSAVKNIESAQISNDNFQSGFGLFEFNTDYPIREVLDGTFNTGYEQGTVSDVTGGSETTTFTLEDTGSASSTDDYYNGMSILFYSATNNLGETRLITDYTGSSRTVVIAAASGNITTSDKYMIFRWGSSDWETSDANKDFITNGALGYATDIVPFSGVDSDYFLCTKHTSGDEASVSMGYVEPILSGASGGTYLTLTPGKEYSLSFIMAAKDKWYNLVSDGAEDGSGTTYGDKVPWVQLYSETVTNSGTYVRTFDSATPSVTAWQASQTHIDIFQTSTSGIGSGAAFDIKTDGSGNPTFYIRYGGINYAVDDTIVITDPGSTSNTATLTVATIGSVGLSLYQNNTWLTQSSNLANAAGGTPKYLNQVDSNYIDNGDFIDGLPAADGANSWYDVGSGLGYSSLDADNFGGHAGGLRIRSDFIFGNDNFAINNNNPSGYFEQRLTLDGNTYYHLNFNYVSRSTTTSNCSLMYAIYDNTKSTFIKGWTTLENTDEGFNGTWDNEYSLNPTGPWRYVNMNTNNSGNKTQDYVLFFVSKDSFSQTSDIRIRFSLSAANELTDYRLNGVTVHKAHNDLSTMVSGKEGSGNPFFNGVTLWSNYTIKFTVPEKFNEVSDWKLRIHGGKWGWRQNNSFTADSDSQATASQEVYLDNIRLVSDNYSTITLLSSNSNDTSKIAMRNSTFGSSWDNNFIMWPNKEAKPVFNYINGILKITDSNFDNNNNSNKLIYYDKRTTSNIDSENWKIKDSPFPITPSLTLSATGGSAMNVIESYIPLADINDLYEDMVWLGGTDQATNWNLANFGTGAHFGNQWNENGWISRYWFEYDGGSIQEIEDANGRFLRNWYENDHEGHPNAGGIIHSDHFHEGGGAQNAHRWGEVDEVTPWHANEKVHAYILGEKLSSHLPTCKAVHSIEFDIMWEYSGNDELVYSMEGEPEPKFEDCKTVNFSAQFGKSNGVIGANPSSSLIQDFINSGTDLCINSKWGKIGSDTVTYQDAVDNNNLYEVSEGDVHIGDNGCVITKANMGINGGGWSGPSNGVICSIRMNGVINGFEPNEFLGDGETPNPYYLPINGDTNLLFKFSELFWGWNENIQSNTYIMHQILDIPYLHRAGTCFASDLYGYASGSSDSDFPNAVTQKKGDGDKYASYTRFKIDNLIIKGYHEEFNDLNIQPSAGYESQVNITWRTPSLVSASGWGERSFDIAISSVNIFGEESGISSQIKNTGELPFLDPDTGEMILGVEFAGEEQAPDLDVFLGKACFLDDFTKTTKYYMRETGTDIWYLQFYINHEDGRLYSSSTGKSVTGSFLESQGNYMWTINAEYMKDYNEVNSYESETMLTKADFLGNGNLTCKYKTSVVCNNRLYVGNIFQNNQTYGDRMIKSPIGKYNILPASNFVDVAINDGDEITALAYYKDKLLQFKRKKVFVINISGDYEFLEDTFNDIGVLGQFSVVTTPYGVIWANKDGCFLYDGKELKDLIASKIPTTSSYANPASSNSQNNRWCANSTTGDCVIGYSSDKQTLLVNFTKKDTGQPTTPSGATYHFPTKSWSLLFNVWGNNSSVTNTGDMSNMITNTDGDIMFFSKGSNVTSSIKKWVQEPDSTFSTKYAYFTTKDITFGDINVKKKLYKVYITYRSSATDGTDSGVIVKGAVNGKGSFSVDFSTSSKFLGTSTDCYGSSTLDETDGLWKTAELKFDTPSEVNNITSFQIQFYSGAVTYDFEVNDISVSYRVKNIK